MQKVESSWTKKSPYTLSTCSIILNYPDARVFYYVYYNETNVRVYARVRRASISEPDLEGGDDWEL